MELIIDVKRAVSKTKWQRVRNPSKLWIEILIAASWLLMSITKPWGPPLFGKLLIRTTLGIWSDGENHLSCFVWSPGANEPDVCSKLKETTTTELVRPRAGTVGLIHNGHQVIQKKKATIMRVTVDSQEHRDSIHSDAWGRTPLKVI